jgi:Family of unknown function (DUF6885)
MLDVATLGPPSLAADYDAELPQKDQLCGCFWGCLALRAFGMRGVDQDAVAREAGTVLMGGDPLQWLPPGETTNRADYRLAFPPTDDPAAAGTGTEALAGAIERLAGGAVSVVPVAGPWRADTVVGLLERTLSTAPDAVLVANVRTGPLWTTRPSPVALLAALAGEAPDVPPCEWDEGHFLSLFALIRGAAGALVGVRDTYRSLGWHGHHLQPPSAVAAALNRGDGREGGVLCVVPAGAAAALREALADFELRLWDNGS